MWRLFVVSDLRGTVASQIKREVAISMKCGFPSTGQIT